jgi:UDP-glucose 4-epimerase
VYGVGQRVGKSQGVLAYWLNAAAFGGQLHLIGDPSSTRDYVYVDDVVDCMRLLAGSGAPVGQGEPLVLNVGTGLSTSLTDLLDMVTTVVGRPLPVKWDAARPVDRVESSLDVRRVAEVLGWRARTGLPEGIARTWLALDVDRSSSAPPVPARRGADLRALAFSATR